MANLNYGVVGNCRTAALISEKGHVDWLCFPDFDSPSVFGRILDQEKGGTFRIEVSDEYTITQKYIPRTNILRTHFVSEEAEFELLDFMPFYKTHSQSENDYYHPPEFYRYLKPLRGVPKIFVRYHPAPDYARGKTLYEVNSKFMAASSFSDPLNKVYLYSSIPMIDIVKEHELPLEKDEFFLVSYNEKVIPVDLEREKLEYCRTLVYWQNWSNRTRKFKLYNDVIERSMLVLKLMSYYNGAVLAALTTSIPETIGEVRNWDYRFCWLRDASMSIRTLFQVGHDGAAKRFMKFIEHTLSVRENPFQIMCGIRGERILTEQLLEHLDGFKGSKPVRVGNAAYRQRQNDSYGYLMDVIYNYYRMTPGTLDEIENMWEIVKKIINIVQDNWYKPDRGIWEIRGRSQHFVSSKVMSWVALDRGVAISKLIHKSYYEKKWSRVAEEIREDIFKHGWNKELQAFTQSYGSINLDSSVLLMEPYGFIDPQDERFIKTVYKLKEELMYKGLMYRYKSEDDFGLPSSAFTICTFWLIRGLYVIGEREEAKKIFDELLTYSNHLGLFSEDLDFHTKEQLGNFPQAYSHLALVNTAILFTDEEKTLKFIRP